MFRKFARETLSTLSVGTYHPIGWGLDRLKVQLKRVLSGEQPLASTLRSQPVLLVHGIFHNSSAFYRLEKKARKLGFDHTRSAELWTAFSTLEEMADKLSLEIEGLLKNSEEGRKVNLIAHSLGGVATRLALMNENFAKSVRRVIFLGTPHQGSPFFGVPFPLCIRDLSYNSELSKRMREEPLPPGIEYWNLRGDMDIVTPAKSTFLPNVPNINFEGVGHAGLLSNNEVIETVLAILQG